MLERRLARMSVGAAIALGAALGLALGVLVSVSTDVPFAPEVGLILGRSSVGSRAGGACSSSGRGRETLDLVAERQNRWPAR